MELSEQSLTPLYQQVMDDLQNGIEIGRFRPGDKIPSENELSEIYGVSRITIRRAIEELAKEGVLTKKQGKGTYVNPPKLTRKILRDGGTSSFTEQCQRSGKKSGARVVSIGSEEAPESTAALLDLPQGTPILRVIRVRTIDGMPVATENCVLPLEPYEFLLNVNLNDTSLFKVISEHTNSEPYRRRKRTIEVVRADSYIAQQLDVGTGEPLFREYAVFLDKGGEPMLACRTHMIAQMFIYDV